MTNWKRWIRIYRRILIKVDRRDRKYYYYMIVGIGSSQDRKVDISHVEVGIVGIEEKVIIDPWSE